MTIGTTRERTGLEILMREYPPNDGIIVAANHMSWVDPLNLSHVLWDAGRPPRFMAKDKLFRLPLVGQIMENTGQIPVYRESDDPASALKAAVAAISNGECVVIYPEGTMTRDPDYWVMTGRTGACHLSLLTGAPVIPIAQWGPQKIMGAYKTELKAFPRKKMIAHIGEPVDLNDLRGKEISLEVLRDGTNRIIDAITKLLEEIRGEPAPGEHLDFREWKKQQELKKAAEAQTRKK